MKRSFLLARVLSDAEGKGDKVDDKDDVDDADDIVDITDLVDDDDILAIKGIPIRAPLMPSFLFRN